MLGFAVSPEASGKPRCAGKRATIVGTPGNDRLQSRGRKVDVVVAKGGNDRIFAAGGRDLICSGSGDDLVVGGAGRDFISTAAGDDFVRAGNGSDKLLAGSGADVLLGGPGGEDAIGGLGDDRFYGGQQDDRLLGSAGNDLLIGDHGRDHLRGGTENDWLRGDTGYDTLDGGPGDDWASFATHTPETEIPRTVSVSLRRDVGRVGGGQSGTDQILTVENVQGSPFIDTIRNEAFLGTGTARGLGWQSDPEVPERKDHCSGFLVMLCDAGPDVAGARPIVLADPTPTDSGVQVIGAIGNDQLDVTASPGQIRVASALPLTTGPGCTAVNPSTAVCPTAAPLGYLLVSGGLGNDKLAVSGSPGLTTSIRIDGGPDEDTVIGGTADEMLDAGGERIDSTGTRDVIIGGGGDDALENSGLGFEVFRGGPGSDQIVQRGCGLLDGGPGGSDIAGFGLSGGVRIRIGGGRVLGKKSCVRVLASNEILEGTQYPDVLIGNNANNPLIIGHGGDDLIMGMGGYDRLRGDAGADRLLGGGGRDVLEARDGQRDKRLDCGAGGGRALRDGRDPQARNCSG